jgi:hypothetical protein
MLAVVVGMAALAIDGARAYALRRDTQAAVDAAALAAADTFQQTGNYVGAEQAGATIFGTNLRLYTAPLCNPPPGAPPITVRCNYSDGSVLTEAVSAGGAQGSEFRLSAARSLQLQFARILNSGANPTIVGLATGNVGNQLYTPALAALKQAGCGGSGGIGISVGGSGTLNVTGDVVTNGSISVSGSNLRVAGDIYAHCQSSVGGATTACYPSGASTPCTFPDVAGATRSGYRLVDPGFGPPSVGGGQVPPSSPVVLPAGAYAANPNFTGGDCWFLSGGVYDWQAGYTNSKDFVSNELKPPDEPVYNSITSVSTHQFWNTNGVNCAGAFNVSNVNGGVNGLNDGTWGVILTSVRVDTYAGLNYLRESAPSACRSVHVNDGDALRIDVSNVPGATSYNVYLSNTGGGCIGPWGLDGNIQVVGTPSNNRPNPCPSFSGNGCSLRHETAVFDSTVIDNSFTPSLSPADTYEAYPPNGETAPLSASLPNQNPSRGAGAAGDRANENNCDSIVGVFATCPAPITPGAVEFYLPSGGCLSTTNTGDTYVFSGYQYDWLSVYEPPSNACLNNTLGADSNSAYIGMVYAPSAVVSITSPYAFEAAATGGVMASTLSFTGALPSITYSASYAPVPPASRLTG